MGNTKSRKIKEKYDNNTYKIVRIIKDNFLNEHEIISFSFKKIELGLKKVIESKDFQLNWESKTILKYFSQTHPNLTDFYFVTKSKKKEKGNFDMIVEYGVLLYSPLKKEKHVWILIDNIISAMIYLEENGLHYPTIRPDYIIKKHYKHYKLLNPYVFSSMLKDILDIYTNEMIKISERKRYRRERIKMNIRELGCLGIYLMGDFNFDLLVSDQSYVEECIGKISRFVSPQTRSFLGYIFDEGLVGESFKEIKEWFEKFISLRTNKNSKNNFYYVDLKKKKKNLDFVKNNNVKKFQSNRNHVKPKKDLLNGFYKDGLDFRTSIHSIKEIPTFNKPNPKNFSTLKYLSHAEKLKLSKNNLNKNPLSTSILLESDIKKNRNRKSTSNIHKLTQSLYLTQEEEDFRVNNLKKNLKQEKKFLTEKKKKKEKVIIY